MNLCFEYHYLNNIWVSSIFFFNLDIRPLNGSTQPFSLFSFQFSSVVQLCLTLCDPMDCSPGLMLGLPVHHQLPGFTQTHVHRVCDAIQPSHPLLPLLLLPSIFSGIRVFSNESGLHTAGKSIGVSASALVLPMNIQDLFPLGLTGWISLQSKGMLRVFSRTSIQKHQFFGIQLSLQSNFEIHT